MDELCWAVDCAALLCGEPAKNDVGPEAGAKPHTRQDTRLARAFRLGPVAPACAPCDLCPSVGDAGEKKKPQLVLPQPLATHGCRTALPPSPSLLLPPIYRTVARDPQRMSNTQPQHRQFRFLFARAKAHPCSYDRMLSRSRHSTMLSTSGSRSGHHLRQSKAERARGRASTCAAASGPLINPSQFAKC